MSTHRRGRGRGRWRKGTVTPCPTGNDLVDFMATLGNMAAAMQVTAEALGNQINQGNHRNNNDEDGPMTLAIFLKVHPLTFRGTSNPTDADNWIQAIERALQAQQVSEEKWVEFGTYQLQVKAQYWWQGTRRILQPDGAVIPWEVFQTEFYKKYFPNSARNAKELELMQLKQGEMTVTEYTSRFKELCRFSRICQGAHEDFAEWKCIKYEGGLQNDILSFVAPIEIRVFSELERSGKELRPREQDFKRGGYTPQPHLGQNNFQRFSNNNSQERGKGKQAQTTPKDLTYRRCGKYHPNTPCRAGLGVCYYCGEAGHLSWNCPEKKKNQEVGKAQHQGRMFTMTADGAGGADTPIRGNHELIIKFSDCLA
ncbi:uncharacterized protein LOC107494147 [Arachis duranensis]|uniref:Uncharacterized protein LOC107494147 n=1 Tax=Arachis duranensis TaxID=130453 RepID=A0A6P4DQL2_ARADU|nr:uncharacterized protein LOC107494147 [Arachis duranensis]